MGLELEAVGVSASHTNTHIEGSAPGITTQKVDIHRLVGKFASQRTPRYTIDWLANVPTVFLWPDNIERKTGKVSANHNRSAIVVDESLADYAVSYFWWPSTVC
jgi:hypothetical protein